MPKDLDERLYTTEEVATRYGVSVQCVRLWLREGTLGGFKAGHKKWIVRHSDLEAFVRRGTRVKV